MPMRASVLYNFGRPGMGKLRCRSVPHLYVFSRSITYLYKTVEQAGHSVQVGGGNARGRELLEKAGSGAV